MSPTRMLSVILIAAALVAGYVTGRIHRGTSAEREVATLSLVHALEKTGVYVGVIQLIETGDEDRALALVRDQLSHSVSAAFYLSGENLEGPFVLPNLIDSAARAQRFYAGREDTDLLEERARVTHERLVALTARPPGP